MPSARKNEAWNGVRQRTRKESGGNEEAGQSYTTEAHSRRRRSSAGPASVAGLVLLLYTAVFCIQLYAENYSLPTPLMLKDAPGNPGKFIAERSMQRLLKLTSLGPRVSGSEANEVHAVELIKKEVQDIKMKMHGSKMVELDVQRVTGAYALTFLDGLTNVYRNVPNVVVKLSSNPEWEHSLLINCHFDSVPDSPGGSDDGASCANMLEILEVLATSPYPLKHNLIFLFNGAEENLMHASHGFITQHPWAKEVRAFVNLEACGAGGREVLFQSGPNSPWIMQTYAKTVPRPYASSMAQEIFASGIVPGDTDFRVFRDFGNISGLDFAWSTNGYVYHTPFDNAQQIPLGTLQRTGENVLELVKGLANAPELQHPERNRPGNLVYFDILGLVVVQWSETVGNILNVSAVLLSLLSIALNRRTFQRRNSGSSYVKELFKAVGLFLVSLMACVAVCLSLALYLTAVGRTMAWYGAPTWLLFLYVIPCITTFMALQLYAAHKHMRAVQSKAVVVQLYLDACLLLWTAILVVAICFQVRSACLPWLWVFSPVLATFLQRLVGCTEPDPSGKWLALFCLGQFGPILQYSGMQVGILGLFIPILGRVGRALNPDVIVGLYSTFTFAFLFSYGSPLIILEKRPGRLLKCLLAVSLGSIALLTFTSLGFPFSGDPLRPRPERYMIVHTERTHYNISRMVTKRAVGYWSIDMDHRTPELVTPYVPDLARAEPVEDCDEYLYCGMPYLMPALSLVSKTHWIPGPAPKMGVPQALELVSKEYYHGNRTMRLIFKASGPDHMGLVFSPRPNVTFEGWSINTAPPVPGPPWQGRPSFFVYYANAKGSDPWTFSLDFLPHHLKLPMVDMVLIGHHLHGSHQRSPELQKLLDDFPPWVALVSWTASYKSYVF